MILANAVVNDVLEGAIANEVATLPTRITSNCIVMDGAQFKRTDSGSLLKSTCINCGTSLLASSEEGLQMTEQLHASRCNQNAAAPPVERSQDH